MNIEFYPYTEYKVKNKTILNLNLNSKVTYLDGKFILTDKDGSGNLILYFYNHDDGKVLKLYYTKTSYNDERIEKIFNSFSLYFEVIQIWEIPESYPSGRDELKIENNSPLGIHANEFLSLIPYLKKIVEGNNLVQSWFNWFVENEIKLRSILSREEYIKLKATPYSKICDFLILLNIDYQPSKRYQWLDLLKGSTYRDKGFISL